MSTRSPKILTGIVLLLLFAAGLIFPATVSAEDMAQIPTGAVATVTGTPSGPTITVKQDVDNGQLNVRSGPGTNYEKVGVLLAGQSAPAKGRSVGGEWIMIEYMGVPGSLAWVYASLVDLTPGMLPIVEPPSTPTPLVTATIDPTLAAQFVVTSAPTRLPTFTEPAPLVIPTFSASAGPQIPGRVPVGMIIIGLFASGFILGLITLAQGR